MPFRSQSQQRLFRAKLAKGEISQATFDRWMAETKVQAHGKPPVKRLPEKVATEDDLRKLAGAPLGELIQAAILVGIPAGAIAGVLAGAKRDEDGQRHLGEMILGALKGGIGGGVAGAVTAPVVDAGMRHLEKRVMQGAGIAAGVGAGLFLGGPGAPKKAPRHQPPPPMQQMHQGFPPELVARMMEAQRQQIMVDRIRAAYPRG